MIFDMENPSKKPFKVGSDRVIKHIDYRKDSLFIIYYDKPSEQIPTDIDECYLKMNCMILYDINDLFQPDWWNKGFHLFKNEDLRSPGFLEYSDR